ncbi:hypothetical protein [Candidatus Trichorickettsia mobilis]|uniref:hypothetical protein n=1 Tax=Candidatus Trichorickettsia mobilis TaxID=1346319 RepID=UPI002931E95C|nr:hypothetical protein [Candidatus Trichorickettsia mobilis]
MKYKIEEKGYSSSGYGVSGKTIVLRSDDYQLTKDYQNISNDSEITGANGIWSDRASAEQILNIITLSGGTISTIYVGNLTITSNKQYLDLLNTKSLTTILTPGIANVVNEYLYSLVLDFLAENKNQNIETIYLYYRDTQNNMSTAEYYNNLPIVLEKAYKMFANNTHLKQFYIAGYFNYKDSQTILNMIKANKHLQHCSVGDNHLEQQLKPHFLKNEFRETLFKQDYNKTFKLLTGNSFSFDEDVMVMLNQDIPFEQQESLISAIMSNPKTLYESLIMLSKLSLTPEGNKTDKFNNITELFSKFLELNKNNLFGTLINNCPDQLSLQQLIKVLKALKNIELTQQLEDLGGGLVLEKIAHFEKIGNNNDLVKLLQITKEKYNLTFTLNTSLILNKLVEQITFDKSLQEITKPIKELGFKVNEGLMLVQFAKHNNFTLSEALSIFPEVKYTKMPSSNLPIIIDMIINNKDNWISANINALVKFGFNQWSDYLDTNDLKFTAAVLNNCKNQEQRGFVENVLKKVEAEYIQKQQMQMEEANFQQEQMELDFNHVPEDIQIKNAGEQSNFFENN